MADGRAWIGRYHLDERGSSGQGRRMSEPIETKDAIIREMIKAIKNLGAKSDLLGTVCSYGETYEDDFLLEQLREWNAGGPVSAGYTSEGASVKAPLTADFLWYVHRAALGGKSSVTGAELPQTLSSCPPGARAAHFAMALAAARWANPDADLPVPEGVTPDEADRVRQLVTDLLGA